MRELKRGEAATVVEDVSVRVYAKEEKRNESPAAY